MLGQRLAELRKFKGLSQYEMAERLGVSRGKLANYEQGSRQPDFDTLSKLADFFGVSTDYLLGRIDEPYAVPHPVLTGPRKKPPYSKIGERLNNRIPHAKNIDRKSIMKSLGIDINEYNALLAGEIAPTEEQAEILAKLFEEKPSFFLPDKDVLPAKNTESLPELTSIDKQDIARKLESILGELDSESSLAFDGEPLDDVTRDLVREQIESNLRLAKQLAKKKFTPKKYRE